MIQNSQLAQVKDQHEITRQPLIQVKITCRPNEANFLEVAFHGGLFFWVNNCHSYENVIKEKKFGLVHHHCCRRKWALDQNNTS